MLKYVLGKLFENRKVEVTLSPYYVGLHYRDVEIPFSRKKFLRGWLTEKSRKFPTLVMVHGWGGSSESFIPILSSLKDLDLNLLVFDVRNHGRSDKSIPVTILTFSQDIRNVLDFLEINSFKGPFLLLGHSMGAASTLLTAAEDERVKGAISIASFADIEEILKRNMLNKGLSKRVSTLIIKAIERSLGRKFEEVAPYASIKNIKVPLLLIHGTDDETVLIKDAYRLKKENPAAELFVVEGADHVTVLQDARVHAKIKEFLRKFL